MAQTFDYPYTCRPKSIGQHSMYLSQKWNMKAELFKKPSLMPCWKWDKFLFLGSTTKKLPGGINKTYFQNTGQLSWKLGSVPIRQRVPSRPVWRYSWKSLKISWKITMEYLDTSILDKSIRFVVRRARNFWRSTQFS